MERLIILLTEEGDLVVDPFVGSGTTAIACKKTKRNYIGIELSTKYCELARKRIKDFDDKSEEICFDKK